MRNVVLFILKVSFRVLLTAQMATWVML